MAGFVVSTYGRFWVSTEDNDGLVGTLKLGCSRAGCPVTTLTLAVDERLVCHATGLLVPGTLPCPVCGESLAPHGFESRR